MHKTFRYPEEQSNKIFQKPYKSRWDAQILLSLGKWELNLMNKLGLSTCFNLLSKSLKFILINNSNVFTFAEKSLPKMVAQYLDCEHVGV